MAVCLTLGIIFLIIGAAEFFHVMPAFIDNFFQLLPEVVYQYLGIAGLALGGLLVIIAILIKVISTVKEKKRYEKFLNAPARPKEGNYYSPMGLEETREAAGLTAKLTTGSDNVIGADGSLSLAKKLGGETKTVDTSAPLVQGGALGGISKASAGLVDNSGLSASFLQREQEERAEYSRVQNIYKGTGSNTNPLFNPNSGGLMMGGQGGPSVGAPDFMGTQANTQAVMGKQNPSPSPFGNRVPTANVAPAQNFNPLTGMAQSQGMQPSPMQGNTAIPPMGMPVNNNPMFAGQPSVNQNPMFAAAGSMPSMPVSAPAPKAEMPKPQGGFMVASKGENPMLVQGPMGGTQGTTPVSTMNPTINVAPMQSDPRMPSMVQSAPSPIMENLPQVPVMPTGMGNMTPNNNPLFK